MSEKKLKPCPFCGGEAHVVRCDEFCCGASIRSVECSGCGAEIWMESYSVKLWNTRQEKGES